MDNLLIFEDVIHKKYTNSGSINFATTDTTIGFNYIDTAIQNNVTLDSVGGITIINKNTAPDFKLKAIVDGTNLVIRPTPDIIYIDVVGISANVIVTSTATNEINNVVFNETGPNIRLKQIVDWTNIRIRDQPQLVIDYMAPVIPRYGEINFSPANGLDYMSFFINTSQTIPNVTTIRNSLSSSDFSKNSNGWLRYSGTGGYRYLINSVVTLQFGSGAAVVSLLVNGSIVGSTKHISTNSQLETHSFNSVAYIGNGDDIELSLTGSAASILVNIHYLSITAKRLG